MGRKGKRRRRGRSHPARVPERPVERGSEAPGEEGRTQALEEEGSAEEPAAGGGPPDDADDADESPSQPRERRGLFGMGMVPSPYPPLAETLRRGVPPAGDPRVVAAAFLFVLALWGLFTALGGDVAPAVMAAFMSVPPVSVFFDALFVPSVLPGAVSSLALLVAILVLRSLTLAAILTWIDRGLRPHERGGDPRRLARVGASLFAIHAAELGAILTAWIILQGLLGPQFGALVAWGVGLYYLGMAPVVVAAEQVSAAEGLRRGFRAARLPGMRHLSLVMLYLVLMLWTRQFAPGGPLPAATPTIAVWVYTLLVTFVHVGVLGALTYRWLAVREEIPASPARRERRR